jgi:hypothetical protein
MLKTQKEKEEIGEIIAEIRAILTETLEILTPTTAPSSRDKASAGASAPKEH